MAQKGIYYFILAIAWFYAGFQEVFAQEMLLKSRVCMNAIYGDNCPESKNSVFADQQLLYYSYNRDKGSDIAKVYFNKAVNYEKNGNLVAAKEFYSRAIICFPALVEAYINLGGVLICLKDYDKAIYVLEKARNGSSEYHEIIYTNIGLSYEGKGDIQKAEYYYDLAISIEPGYVLAHNNLAKLYLKKDQYWLAMRELKTVNHLAPGFLKTDIVHIVENDER
jgi:tetratricopeptide (TPR) repeat protein